MSMGGFHTPSPLKKKKKKRKRKKEKERKKKEKLIIVSAYGPDLQVPDIGTSTSQLTNKELK